MSKFAIIVEFVLQESAYDPFLELVSAQASDSLRLEPNCEYFDVCVDPDTSDIVLYEIYASRSDFDAHLASDHFKNFDAASAPLVTRKAVRILDLVQAEHQ